ncbi:MAG: glucose 1-dehydrogenase [Candidatus Planktophila sp.]|nr:glucose 1-dehydrogenase [Candidatus Planktophila sp.]
MTGLELFSLKGKTALISGAGGAIGSVLAQAMSQAGATVAIQDLTLEKLQQTKKIIEATGGRVFLFAADLTDTAACTLLAAEAASALGSIDILVNCAGINRRKSIVDVTLDDFEAIVAVNMRAVYFLSQAVHSIMKVKGSGSIVNVSSITARFSFNTVSVYAATKAAVSSMTRSFAREWISDGIRVNCIEPGYVKTEFTRPLWGDPKRSEWFNNFTPIGRMAEPEELVGAVIYLASEASSYVTGQSILIDGGVLSGADFDS